MTSNNGDIPLMDERIGAMFHGEVPPDVEQRMRQHLAAFRGRLAEEHDKPSLPARVLHGKAAALVGFAASVAIVCAVWIAMSPRPQSLYAQVIAAMKKIETVHMQGWTRSLGRSGSTQRDKPDPTIRRDVEIWEWATSKKVSGRYERTGPVVTFFDVHAEREYEYQTDRNLLYVRKRSHGRDVSEYASMAREIKDLKNERTVEREDLGTVRGNDGQQLWGVRLGYKEFWFNTETHLPVKIVRYRKLSDGKMEIWGEVKITYDDPVPDAVRNFQPPAAAQIEYSPDIDPATEPWREHKTRIIASYHDRPLPDPMDLIPRKQGEIFAVTWGRSLSGPLAGYSLQPLALQMKNLSPNFAIGHYVRFAGNSFIPVGCLRVAVERQSVHLNHDLVVKHGTSGRDQVEFVLSQFNLELVKLVEPRNVWVAEYDGRPLKPYREVTAPVPHPERAPLGPGMASMLQGCNLEGLFHDFAFYQNSDLSAKHLVIVDQTGIPSATDDGLDKDNFISNARPYWGDEASIEIAGRWFAEQFGITFREETHDVTIYVVQGKKTPTTDN